MIKPEASEEESKIFNNLPVRDLKWSMDFGQEKDHAKKWRGNCYLAASSIWMIPNMLASVS
jgi:hypothetical protein